MSFLDQKEVIYDVVLTNRGRELLSKNQLNFVFYAFSDEGVNYAAHLSSSVVLSQSVDNIVRKNLFFEADQRKDRDLSSFLYTIPADKRTLPSVTLSVATSSSLSLERKYTFGLTGDLDKVIDGVSSLPVDVVVSLVTPVLGELDRAIGYGVSQTVKSLLGTRLVRQALENLTK